MRQTPSAITVENDVFNALGHSRLETIAQSSLVFRALRHLLASEFGRHTKCHDARDAFCACSLLTLLMPADILRNQTYSSPQKQRTGSLRRVKLVSRKRQQIAT